MKVEVTGMNQLIRKYESQIKDIDKTIKMALQEGGEVLTTVTRDEIKRAANRGYSQGNLARSVLPTQAAKNRWGYFVAVRPTGTDPKGVRNGAKWGYLKYGNGRGSEPRDFDTKAVKNSEDRIARAAQAVFERRSKLK